MRMIREYIIKISDEIMEEEIADRPQELVRCKDCYWRSEVDEECANSDSVCYRNGRVQDDFFCADGERKES